MGKPAILNDEAYEAIQSAKLSAKESISDVILRLVPRPLNTFADLKEHLERLDGPVIVDQAALDRLRKAKTTRAD
jgi:predicted CopG family antitoxin